MPPSNPQARVPESPARSLPREDVQTLPLTVLYTGVLETLGALREAAALAFELRASIRILVIQVVPYPLPIECPRVQPEFRLRQFRALWNQERIDTTIDIRLCRDSRRCLQDELSPNSVVVIGGRRSWWPFTQENRAARFLKRAGHQVIWTADCRSDKQSCL